MLDVLTGFCVLHFKLFFSPWPVSPHWPRSSHCWDFEITLKNTPHSVGLLWTSDQPDAGPLPDNTQQLQERDILRTRNASKHAAADPHLRPRGYWDRNLILLEWLIKNMRWAGRIKCVRGTERLIKNLFRKKSKRGLGRSRPRCEELSQLVCSSWDVCQFSVSIQDEEFL